MKKLELRDIAGYLPYGLKVLRPDQITMLEMRGLLGTLVQHKEKDEITYSSLSGCTPYLRPMSDLTCEITHKGKKFAPMAKLYEAAHLLVYGFGAAYDTELCDWDNNERTCGFIADHGDGWSDGFTLNVSNNNVMEFNFTADRLRTKSKIIVPQYQLFDLLNEWMLDYRDLIGQGLAIDVNTLKENCYE